MSDLMKVGADFGPAGTFKPFTAGLSGQQRVSDAHGRFMQAALEGRLFSGGMGALTSISNVTFTSATLGATCTPIIGVYNPASSNRNLSILQAMLAQIMTALAVTGGGPLVWAVSTGNTGISTGAVPFNRLTLARTGSIAKDVSGVALTGLTNNLVVAGGSALGGGSAENVSFTATAVAMQTQMQGFVENIDGSWIVPPGGVLALLATTTPVAHSATSGLLWEELPIMVQG